MSAVSSIARSLRAGAEPGVSAGEVLVGKDTALE
jgi:hypothetical protein